MKRTLILLLALSLAGSLFAADKTVGFAKAPLTVLVGQIVQLPVTGLDLAAAKRSQTSYYPRQGVLFLPAVTWDGTLTIIFSAQTQGQYLVGIYFPNADGSVGKTETEIVVGTPGPTPPPVPPGPTPPPVPPVPTPTVIQAVIIEETGDSTAAFSAVRNSKSIRDWAEAGGHRIFFLDDESAAKSPTFKYFADRAVGKPLPYLFIAPAAGGDVLKEQPAPDTVAAFLVLLEAFGGKAPAVAPSDCPGGVCPVPALRPWRR